MAYIDPDQPKEVETAYTSKSPRQSPNQLLYNSVKNNQQNINLSDAIKLLLTGIAIFFYIRPIARFSSELATYEFIAILLFGMTGAFMARNKNNAVNGFFLGALLCPLGLVAAAYLDDRTRTPCKHCAELIKTDATVCPFCKSSIIE